MIRLLLSLLVISALASCGSPPANVIGVDDPSNPAANVPGVDTEVVYVATSRAAVSDPTVMFGSKRVQDNLNFIRVEVSIPPTHQTGQIERSRRVPPDPRRDFAILNPQVIEGRSGFIKAVDTELAGRPSNEHDVMLFVHGYNTDLVGSIMRAAQIKRDSGFQGIPVVFAWASLAKTTGYAYDLNSVLQARDWLVETAVDLGKTRTKRMNVVAHSMGNLLAVEAMRQRQLLDRFNSNAKLQSIILAAPDIDVDLFKRQMAVFPKDQRRFYVLISADDKALRISRRLAGGINRVGNDDAEDLAAIGVTVIDVTNIKDPNSLDHSKFSESPEVVQLIGRRLNEDDSFTDRPSVLEKNLDGAAEVISGVGGGLIAIVN